MPRLLENVNFPRLVTIFAVTFGLTLGACGLTALAGSGKLLALGMLELALMLLSAAGLLLTLIV
jgi:hypothetical protein